MVRANAVGSFNEAPAKRGGNAAKLLFDDIERHAASMRPPRNAGEMPHLTWLLLTKRPQLQ